MTRTTEQLRERIRGLEITLQHKNWEAVKADLECLKELLAVREARRVPVAYRYRYNGKHLASAGCGDMVSSWKYCEEVDVVNPDERYEHQALFTAPPAPEVPDFGALTKLIVGRLIDCGTASDDSIADAEVFVYNACRAAMLTGGKS